VSGGAHLVAERTARALDIVERLAGRTGSKADVMRLTAELMLDPVARAIIPTLLVLMSRSVRESAETSGRPVAEVVAGLRAATAEVLDGAERLLGGSS
jgi:hypothetical protein